MAEYQNALDKIQQANTGDVAKIQELQRRGQIGTSFGMAGIGAVGDIAGSIFGGKSE